MTQGVTLPSGYQLIAYEHATSTNQIALDRIASGQATDGDVIWALSQSAGRGRRGREWQSLPGNLFATYILRHDGPLARAAELSFVVALAVCRTVNTLNARPDAPAATCKWPNDVLVGGKKIAGILLEVGAPPTGDAQFIAAGIGLNLAQAPDSDRYPTTSLAESFGLSLAPGDVLSLLTNALNTVLTDWRNHGFGPVRREWLRCAHGVGEQIVVRTGETELRGVFSDLDDNGALRLSTADGSLAISAGDVHFPAVPKNT